MLWQKRQDLAYTGIDLKASALAEGRARFGSSYGSAAAFVEGDLATVEVCMPGGRRGALLAAIF